MLGIATNNIIPPPITMKWQLAVTDENEQYEEYEDSQSSEIIFDESEWIHSMHYTYPKLSMDYALDYDDNIIRILCQYNDYYNYNVYSTIVVTGYIRNVERNLSTIIPDDISNVCLSFYFEKENDFIHLAYNLYKIIHETTNNITINYFSGKALSSMVKSETYNLDNTDQLPITNINEICSKLIEYKFIEIVSYKTNFSSSFHTIDHSFNKNGSFFNESNDTRFQFTCNVFRTFQRYFH
eukprot:784358_1